MGTGEGVIDALMEYMEDEPLVFPTHTWKDVVGDGSRFYVETSPSGLGILPEPFRKREDVIRCYHPTHSVAAIGMGAKELVRNSRFFDTPCSRRSP